MVETSSPLRHSRFGIKPFKPSPRQHGLTLIVLVFLIGLATTAYLINALNSTTVPIERDKKSYETLSSAKNVLIGYLLDRVSGGERPGDMPYPDRLLSPAESPPNYDGNTDSCVITGGGTTVRWNCLGRFPWASLGLSLESPSENDPEGRMPWYAVSANMLDVCLKEFNPSILNYSWPAAYPASCPGTPVSGVLPHPWLTVRDKYGNIISNRVAAVLIIPGPAIGGQARPASPNLADASQYLDSVTISNTCTTTVTCVPGTYSNADLDSDFIMADDSRYYFSCNTIFHGADCQTAYNFNDRLVYITIDDIMKEVVKRAAGEAKSLLTSYKSKNTIFPYAAALGTTGSYDSAATTYEGMLPIDTTDTCSCSSNIDCTCSFGPISSLSFTKGGTSNFSSKSNNCSFSSKTCTCTGQGSCSTTTRTFSCSPAGNCSYSGSTTGSFKFTPPSYADIYSTSAGCSISSSNAVCTSSGSFNIGLKEPTWFKNNLWQEYLYYRWSASSNLQVGTTTGVSALVVGAGRPITATPFAVKGLAQTRPSSNLNDYLDSAENTDGDLVYDATNTSTSNSYNDQTFIVAP